MKAKNSNHSRSIYLAKLPRLARKLRVMMALLNRYLRERTR